jgi:phosphonate transport system substrate-binding protein
VCCWLLAGLCLLGVWGTLQADEPARVVQPIRFGILPMGSAGESREQWRPLLEDLARRLRHPVMQVSVGSYAGLSSAIAGQRVDVAFVSGQLAVDAVTRQRMTVVARFVRGDGSNDNAALLIVRADGPIRGLNELLAKAGRWRYARGEKLSVCGYLAPEAMVFAPRGLNSDTFFARVREASHQGNALALANGEVDVASGSAAELDLFRQNFPDEAAALRVIWRSPPIPTGVLVVSDGMAGPLRGQLIAFLRDYGAAADDRGARERARLARIPGLFRFAVADDGVLQPVVDMQYDLLRQQARHGRWISEQARHNRLAQIEQEYRRASQSLRRP